MEVCVYEILRVGLISTGDEIVPAETKEIKKGQVRDSNKLMFKVFLTSIGAHSIVDFGSVSDDRDKVKQTITQAS